MKCLLRLYFVVLMFVSPERNPSLEYNFAKIEGNYKTKMQKRKNTYAIKLLFGELFNKFFETKTTILLYISAVRTLNT